MKLKNFSFTTFFLSIVIFGLMVIPAFLGALSSDPNITDEPSLFIYFCIFCYKIVCFPTLALFPTIAYSGGLPIIILGLLLNCIFYAVAIERIISVFRKSGT